VLEKSRPRRAGLNRIILRCEVIIIGSAIMRAPFVIIAIAGLVGCASRPDSLDRFIAEQNAPPKGGLIQCWDIMYVPVVLPARPSQRQLVDAAVSNHNDGLNKWIDACTSLHVSKDVVESFRQKLITSYKIRKVRVIHVDPWKGESTVALLQTNLGDKLTLSHNNESGGWYCEILDPIATAEPSAGP
jgi:hypothetical protein